MIKEFSINELREKILEEILIEKPDIVAFSTYIWNITYVEELSKLIKVIDPNIEILYGGPEVSYDACEFLKNCVGDYVIEGEGEDAYREFIEYKLNLRELNEIKGLYYKYSDSPAEYKINYNGRRPLINMNNIVFPYEAQEVLDNKIVYYEASRGCPFNCKYCLSSTQHGVRFLDIERVKSELQFLIDKKVRLIKFVDRTFNCNSKFSIAIWSFLIDQPTDTVFHFEISADILKKEEIELLAKAPKGRFQFEVGVQTTNDEVLRNINRFVNFDDIKEKIEELQRIKNIKQHLDLIAGLPGENFESFKKSFNDVHSIRPEEIQLGFLKLLKGSSMREEAKLWDMKYSPFPPYEILSTKDISYFELLKLKKIEAMVDKYYNSQKFKNILAFFQDKFTSPFDFFEELSKFFHEKGYFHRSISNSEYYKVFLDFNKEILKDDELALKEIVRYDYLQFNKRRGMPEFIFNTLNENEERTIKEYLKENFSKKASQYYIEKFNIDIFNFVKSKKISEEVHYILSEVDEKDASRDITKELNIY